MEIPCGTCSHPNRVGSSTCVNCGKVLNAESTVLSVIRSTDEDADRRPERTLPTRIALVLAVVTLAAGIVAFAYEHHLRAYEYHLRVDEQQAFTKERGSLRETTEEMQATIQDLQAKIQVLEETAQSHFRHGVDDLAAGQPYEAKGEFETVISKYPSDPIAAHARERLEEVSVMIAQQEAAVAAQNAELMIAQREAAIATQNAQPGNNSRKVSLFDTLPQNEKNALVGCQYGYTRHLSGSDFVQSKTS